MLSLVMLVSRGGMAVLLLQFTCADCIRYFILSRLDSFLTWYAHKQFSGHSLAYSLSMLPATNRICRTIACKYILL